MNVHYISPDPPPVPWGDKLAAMPMPPAIVPEEGLAVKDKDVARLIELAQRALRVLDSFNTDASRLACERFTLDELAARGGVAGLLKDLDIGRLNEPRKAVAELRKLIGYRGQLALDWDCGGFSPVYHTVESLTERVSACEVYAAELSRAWGGT